MNPYSRVHQEKLLRFRDEISSIQKVQHDQIESIINLRDLSWPGTTFDEPRVGYDYIILRHCIWSVRDRITEFEGMNTRAINLGLYVSPQHLRCFPAPVPITPRIELTCHLHFSEHPTHRSQQGPSRSRHPRFHSRNNHLPPAILHLLAIRHEHLRHT